LHCLEKDFPGAAMETRFIESFSAIVETGSIAAASRRLNLTQEALAQRLKALERDIGVPLVSRVGQTVKPTSAGLAIIPLAQELLFFVRQMRSIAMGDANIVELHLGAIRGDGGCRPVYSGFVWLSAAWGQGA
jgi:DNA-binding transcriptional LysR family regulator